MILLLHTLNMTAEALYTYLNVEHVVIMVVISQNVYRINISCIVYYNGEKRVYVTVRLCRFYINKYLPTCVYCVIIVHYDGYINTTPHNRISLRQNTTRMV